MSRTRLRPAESLQWKGITRGKTGGARGALTATGAWCKIQIGGVSVPKGVERRAKPKMVTGYGAQSA